MPVDFNRPLSPVQLTERAYRADAALKQSRHVLERKKGLLQELGDLESKYSDLTSWQWMSSISIFDAHMRLEAEIKMQVEAVKKADRRRYFAAKEAGFNPDQELPPKAPDPQ